MSAEVPSIPSEIRASAFVLIDEDGRNRGALEVADGDPRLTLRDGAGHALLVAKVGNGSPSVLLADEHGVVRAGVDSFADGPSLFLRDRNGDVRIGLDFVDESDTAFITLMTPKRTLVELSAAGKKDTAQLNMFGEDKTVRLSLAKEEDDRASIVLAEQMGRVTFLAAGGSVILSRGDSTRVIGIQDRQIDV